MRFELNEILTNEILFYMENQDGEFFLDTKELIIIDIYNKTGDEEPDLIDDDRYISIPHWEPKDGYRLMGKFAAGLKNPVVRHELDEALNRSKGVFKAYKTALEQYPKTEKLWFKYKERQMKNEVISWYNALREEWGLKPIGAEPEDYSSLILEDFIFKEEENIFCITAENSDGEKAGGISAELFNAGLKIKNIEVKPEYRGMGLGKILIAKLIEKADRQKLDVTIDLPAETDFFARSLLLENFKLCSQKFIRKYSDGI